MVVSCGEVALSGCGPQALFLMGALSLDRLGRRLPGWCAAFEVAARFQNLLRQVSSLYIAVVGFGWVIFVYTVWIGGFPRFGRKAMAD